MRATKKTGSDFCVSQLIRKYSEKSMRVLEGESTGRGTLRLIPRLKVNAGSAFLELTVGESRQYVVKSISEFCDAMKHGRSVDYGKHLTFRHSIEAFHPEARPLIDFLMRRYQEVESYSESSFRAGNGYGSLYTKDRRGIVLSPSALDHFFELSRDQRITIAFRSDWQYEDFSYVVKEMNPRIQLEVKRDASDGSFSVKTEKFLSIAGERHLFLASESGSGGYDDRFLWCCDGKFAREMRDFIEITERTGTKFVIAEQDMPEFCGSVFSEMRDFVDVVGDAFEFEQYVPQEMEAFIYLDSPRSEVITAVAICKYGDVEFDLYGGNGVAAVRLTATDGDDLEESERGAAIVPAAGGKARIVRDTKNEYRIKMLLSKYFDTYDRKLSVLYFEGNNDRIYNFISQGAVELSNVAEIMVTDRYKRIGAAPPPKLTVGVHLENDLLKVEFDLERFPVDELMDALADYKLRKRYHRLKDGRFLQLADDDFEDILNFVEGFRLTREDIEAGRMVAPKYRAMYLNGLLKNADGEKVSFVRDSGFRSMIRSLKSVEDSDYEVPESLKLILRDYQKTGYRWLRTMAEYGFGGILADDMGLGKTLQVITLFMAEKENGKPSLVVCPASLVLNWEKEIRDFAPQLNTLTVIGSAQERRKKIAMVAAQNRDCEDSGLEEILPEEPYDVVLTSYDLLKRDINHYEDLVFRYHIIDEAQFIKNHSTQNAKAVKGIKSEVRFALTGTPIENRLSELWSIFDFLMPDYLREYSRFRDEYETTIVKENDQTALALLEKQISPFVLRRLKSNVLKELPDKIESVVYTALEPEQERLYMANLAKVKLEIGKEMKEGGFEVNKIVILALLTRLRQLCCHPLLCYEDYRKGSGKLAACMELVNGAVDGGHKILLFSQFTSMLDLIKVSLDQEGIRSYMLTGKTSKEKRREYVERFNADDVPVFLISLKAGGTGLNLTGADIVIHYDPWWNLAAQNQATDRTHRIGQKKSVQVYKLIAKGTIEEKILKMQENKRVLADSIIKENESPIASLSSAELLGLL